MLRRTTRIFGIGLLAFSILAWPLMFAYADWLRFASPHSPNPATGQSIYMKAVKGVFYVTAQQDRLVGGGALFAVWLIGALGALFVIGSKDGEEPKRGLFWVDDRKRAPLWLVLAAWLFAAYWFGLFWFGDNAMALLITGSLTPPPDLHRFEPTVVPSS